jgi:signal transduction histidine kinase
VSLRWRLTALYSGLFLLTSTLLLVVVNLLLGRVLRREITLMAPSAGPPARFASGVAPAPPPVGTGAGSGGTDAVQAAADHALASKLSRTVLHYQWGVTVSVIMILTLMSVAVGWWLAGRLLDPLGRITATARRLSLAGLHERIALSGPRGELKNLADTFDAMLGRLERSVDSQRRFIANAAHELRTPLATQRAAIQIGLEDPLPDRLVPVRATLLAANRRTERLIEALLVLAQADHGLDRPEPVDLTRIARQAADEAGAGAPEAVDAIAVTMTAQACAVDGDPTLLGRLVANLVDNAVRYNRPGGRVDVAVSADGVLTVRNTGPRVPGEAVAELFEPFRRLPAARAQSSEGSGLGLSIAAAIAHAHGATIDARPNDDGGGLMVTVRFPVYDGLGAGPAYS